MNPTILRTHSPIDVSFYAPCKQVALGFADLLHRTAASTQSLGSRTWQMAAGTLSQSVSAIRQIAASLLSAAQCKAMRVYPRAFYTEILELCTLSILNPDLKERQTAKIRLNNGLEAYLISDPQADQSGAGMTVKTGSWSDPAEYPGMAHFCEHMLFLGSRTYPQDNGFSTRIKDQQGQSNAYTSADQTVYLFSGKTSEFKATLDHFSRFFIDPLFAPSGIAGEMQVVDQEFAKDAETDSWRTHMVLKQIGNQEHPHAKFTTGNSSTLANIPQEALKEWHRTHYAADKMRLVLYSSLPLAEMKAMAAGCFTPVPASKEPSSPIGEGALFSETQKGQLVLIKPIKETRALTLCWELPGQLAIDPSKSAEFAAYLLQRGQPWSLYEILTKEGLIDRVSANVTQIGSAEHSLFQVNLALTQEGLDQLQTTIQRVFEALATLQDPPEELFEEMNRVRKLGYQFQSRAHAYREVSAVASDLFDEPMTSFPETSLLAKQFDPAVVKEVFSTLDPKDCCYVLLANPSEETKVKQPLLAAALDRKEPWMGAEYSMQALPKEWIEAFQAAKPHPELRMPRPNPLLPEELELCSGEPQAQPLLLADDAGGKAYYQRAAEFQSPVAIAAAHIASPVLEVTPKCICLKTLYLDALRDVLHPYVDEAADAHFGSTITFGQQKLHFKVSGFSDKLPAFARTLLEQLRSIDPTPGRFEQYKQRYAESIANGSKQLAYTQVNALATSLLYRLKYTQKDLLTALESITREDLVEFAQKLFQETHIEALFSGNLSEEAAKQLWGDLRRTVQDKPFEKERHYPFKTLALAEGPFLIHEKTSMQGHAAMLLLDMGSYTLRKRASQEILNAALEEQFFDTLRTKQNTGYIAQCSTKVLDTRRLLNAFLVQSSTHQPLDLLHRFELFLETSVKELEEDISRERFEELKESVLEELRAEDRNLHERHQWIDFLAFDMKGDFTWLDKRVQHLEELTYEEFLEDAKAFLAKSNKKRLAILYEGQVKDPFSYELVERNDPKIGVSETSSAEFATASIEKPAMK